MSKNATVCFNYNIKDLINKIKRRQDFKLRLPGFTKLFKPSYGGLVYLENEIVIFESEAIPSLICIGVIRNRGPISATNRTYDVDCILKPVERKHAERINRYIKYKLNRTDILCELIESEK